ncbi:MAG: MlaD family protein [Planctomycetota bacterium]|jgi:hypothetical protein
MERTGLLRVVSAAALLALLFSVGTVVLQFHNPHFFKASRVFRFYMRKASGVEEGTPVWVNGLNAGEVTNMTLEEIPATLVGGKEAEGTVLAVKCTARVYAPYHEMLRENSQVEVLLLSVLGKPRVYVHPGPPAMPPAPNRDFLGQRITRGIEGKAEEFLDRSSDLNEEAKALSVYLDSLGESTREIEARYKKGRNTFRALVGKEEDRDALNATSESLDANAGRMQEVIRSIRDDVEALGKDPFGSLDRDLKAVKENFDGMEDEGGEAEVRWKQFSQDFERFRKVAQAAVEGAKRFYEDLRVLLLAKDRFIPAMDADRKIIQHNLFGFVTDRIKVAVLPAPRDEEVLRAIQRGRLKKK